MDRRLFTKYAAAAAAVGAFKENGDALFTQTKRSHSVASETEVKTSMTAAMAKTDRKQIAMLLYPGAYPLDLIGPYTFLAGLMNADVYLVWKTLDPVAIAQKLSLKPTLTFEQCPKDLDVIFVPGGVPGTIAMMQDIEVLDFLADRGARSRYITSVCTGSLILGAAGLLRGYRATSHWNTRDILPILGAIPVQQRIVEDRNRITGGGVTSGIDFGLLLTARMSDKTYAEMLQLLNEYDPHPPFQAGTPAQAGPAITKHLDALLQSSHDGATTAAKAARLRLGIT
jgi:cyclohexyl-isocyanide hydratase